jgi:hypothetical protein
MTPFIRPGEQVFRACSPERRLPSGVVSADVASLGCGQVSCSVRTGTDPGDPAVAPGQGCGRTGQQRALVMSVHGGLTPWPSSRRASPLADTPTDLSEGPLEDVHRQALDAAAPGEFQLIMPVQ